MTAYIPSLTLPSFFFEHPASAILIPVTLGTGVGFSVRPKQTQSTYMALKQPPLRPPPYVFGPMWTLLYASMGYAAYRAWNTGMNSFDANKVLLTKVIGFQEPLMSDWLIGAGKKQQGATLYTIQLGLNLIWMPLFFSLKRPIEATVDIVALTAITGYLAYIWGQVDEVAGWSLVPYIGWLSFATYLSAGAGYLNDWDFQGKEKSTAQKTRDTKYVDEKDK